MRDSPASTLLNYVFRLTLSDDTDEILGEETVDLRFLKDNLADFTLDLVSVHDGKGMSVSEVHRRAQPCGSLTKLTFCA